MKSKVKCICNTCGKEFLVYSSIVRSSGGKYCSNECKNISKTTKIKCICEVCRKEFFKPPSIVNRGWGKYCSKKCRGVAESAEKSPVWKGGKIKSICQTCGNEFFVKPSDIKSGGGKYCSKKCSYDAKIKRVKCICKTCGKEFETRPCQIKRGGGKYCSSECSHVATRGENSIHWEGGDIKRKCPVCGKEFFTVRAKVKNNLGKFCSRKCMGISFRENNLGENNPNWRGGKIKSICEMCGKEFFVNLYKSNSNELGKYCSKKCKDLSNSGERSPRWKGGTTYFPYCSKFNKRRKEDVREFFGRKCLACGAEEIEFRKRLSVHHVDHDKEQGCNGKPFNLVPLCKNCHAKEIFREEEYKKYINKTLEEGFKWGIWNKEEYIKKVMYPDN